MVANLSAGRKGFEEISGEMKDISSKAAEYRKRFSGYIQKDSEAYTQVMTAITMSRSSEIEKESRSRAIQKGLRTAAEVPLALATETIELLHLAETVVEKGNPNAITDGLVAVMMARSAVLGAIYNVKINLATLRDESYVDRTTARIREMEGHVKEMERRILEEADLKLNHH
jgi:methenyltetrahydrofolate cyclohydrolase